MYLLYMIVSFRNLKLIGVFESGVYVYVCE